MSGFPVRWRLIAFVLGLALALSGLVPAAVQAAVPPGQAVVGVAAVGDSWVGRMWDALGQSWLWRVFGNRQDMGPKAPVSTKDDGGCLLDPNGHCVTKALDHHRDRHGRR